MLTVMTYNMYVGADLRPLLVASTEAALDMAVVEVITELEATDFRIRARLLAQEISSARPDLIALQEAVLWDIPATTLSSGNRAKSDYLQLLLNALRTMGHEYWPVSLGNFHDVEGPPSTLGLRYTNRTVILVRSNFCTGECDIRLPNKGQFAHCVEVDSPMMGPIPLARGWTSIDVVMHGKQFRFVSVHLEDRNPEIQYAQTAELIRRLSLVDLPIVLVGDFNVNADPEHSPTYAALLHAGYSDSWLAHGALHGSTCCQAPDLRNEQSMLTRRADYIFTRGALKVVNPFLVGIDPDKRRANGLWPSDRAGIVGTVQMLG